MTGALASVTSADEAAIALAAGADIIDLKNPASGALGALPGPVIRAALARVAARAPVSATVGDLPLAPAPLARAVTRMGAHGVDIVKVGLFPGGDLDGSLAALGRAAAGGQRIVVVLFADLNPDFALVERALALGLAGVMLDTADKSRGTLRTHLDDTRLAEFVRRARAAELLCGLAGSLGAGDIAPLAALAPDYLGFRGALCVAGRTTRIEAARARDVCDAVHASAAASAATATAGAQRAAHSRAAGAPSMQVEKST